MTTIASSSWMILICLDDLGRDGRDGRPWTGIVTSAGMAPGTTRYRSCPRPCGVQLDVSLGDEVGGPGP